MKFTGYNFKLGDEDIWIESSMLVIAAAAKNASPSAQIHLCGKCNALCLDMKWCTCCEYERPMVADTMFRSTGIRGAERAQRRPADSRTHRLIPSAELAPAFDALRAA